MAYLSLSFTLISADLAQFTGAKDRIALGKKARKDEAKKRKATIAEMIDEAYVLE